MTWLVSQAMRLGIPEAYARLALIIAGITLLVGAVAVTKCSYDRSLIAQHDVARDVSLAEGARAADGNAAATRRVDDARLSTESVQLNEVIAHAPLAPVSDARRAYYDCIGLQQAARAAGRPAPAC